MNYTQAKTQGINKIKNVKDIFKNKEMGYGSPLLPKRRAKAFWQIRLLQQNAFGRRGYPSLLM